MDCLTIIESIIVFEDVGFSGNEIRKGRVTVTLNNQGCTVDHIEGREIRTQLKLGVNLSRRHRRYNGICFLVSFQLWHLRSSAALCKNTSEENNVVTFMNDNMTIAKNGSLVLACMVLPILC